MAKHLQTPSQTVGPFFAYGLTPEQYSYDFDSWFDENLSEEVDPDTILVLGRVFDGEGKPVDDAVLELWHNDLQNQAFGRYGTGTDPQQRFFFKTKKPEPVGGNAPFLSVVLFMRGALLHLYTRIYFSDEAERNQQDEILQLVPENRRHTLLAQKQGSVYEFNIYMQGKKETVFFDV